MRKLHVNWQKSVAELLTIAVGVLLGLAANDWRDSARDRAEASAYEARLDEAVAADLNERPRRRDSGGHRLRGSGRAGRVPGARGSPGGSQRVPRGGPQSQLDPPPAVAHDTYDDLVTTGGLRLLPVGMRAQLAHYYGQAQVYADREQSFRQTLSAGYWRVPAMVLGPELLPELWKGMADLPPDQRHVGNPPTVSARELGEVVARLRRISDLETQIADVRHVMIQREVNYAVRMTTIAAQLRHRLAAPK